MKRKEKQYLTWTANSRGGERKPKRKGFVT